MVRRTHRRSATCSSGARWEGECTDTLPALSWWPRSGEDDSGDETSREWREAVTQTEHGRPRTLLLICSSALPSRSRLSERRNAVVSPGENGTMFAESSGRCSCVPLACSLTHCTVADSDGTICARRRTQRSTCFTAAVSSRSLHSDAMTGDRTTIDVVRRFSLHHHPRQRSFHTHTRTPLHLCTPHTSARMVSRTAHTRTRTLRQRRRARLRLSSQPPSASTPAALSFAFFLLIDVGLGFHSSRDSSLRVSWRHPLSKRFLACAHRCIARGGSGTERREDRMRAPVVFRARCGRSDRPCFP